MGRVLRLVCFFTLTTVLSIPGFAATGVIVPCPGAAVDSSPSITNALVSVGPRGTVWLEECTYYLSGPVVVTGSFNGALRGAGMGRTILTTLLDADGIEDVLMRNWITDLDNPGSPGPTRGPTLFHFSLFGGKPSQLAMSDLTIAITDLHPAFASARALWFTDALLAIITVEGVKVSTEFDRIELEGTRSNTLAFGSNVCYGIEIWGELSYWPDYGTKRPMVGDHVVSRSIFKDSSTGYNFGEMVNSRTMVRGNRFVNPVYDAVDGGDMQASRLHVTHNDIELSGAAFGIWLLGLKGALVNQNRISGEGGVGIDLVSGSRYEILNNDLRDLTVPADSFAIVLGADTSDSLVVGADPASVLDLGTYNRVLPGKAK